MSLRYAMLGLIAHGPRTGYDIKREFDNSVGHAWNASSSQIYPALHELQRSGLVTVRDDGPSSRRSVYFITEEGRRELDGWLSSPTELKMRRDPFLLKVFMLDLTDHAGRYRQLRWFIDEQERFLRVCEDYRRRVHPDSDMLEWRIASMELAEVSARAMREWAENKVREMADRHPGLAALENARQTALR